MRLAALLFLALARPGLCLEVLRLPWIFSDEPELTADFSFSPAPGGKTKMELSLGGRFAHVGLPRGAARAPIMEVACEVVAPGDFVRQVAKLKGKLDLKEALSSYGVEFSRKAFEESSPYVYKTEMSTELRPGDYNVSVELNDVELSIQSRRTLHVIVPSFSGSHFRLSDLKFLLGVGEEMGKGGKMKRVLDPNPWRQAGGKSGWDLLVAFDAFGEIPPGKLLRRYSVSRLRGDGSALWSEEGELKRKQRAQVWLASMPPQALAALSRGVYVFSAELWPQGNPKAAVFSTKTFEVP